MGTENHGKMATEWGYNWYSQYGSKMGRLGLSTGWERTALIYNWMSKSFCLEMGYLESQVYDNHKSDRWLTHFARNLDNLRAKLTLSTGRRPSMLVSSVSWQIHQQRIHSEFTKTKEEIRRGESSKMSWKKITLCLFKGFSHEYLHLRDFPWLCYITRW